VIFAFLALFIFFLKKYKKIIDTFIYHKIDEKSSFLTVVFLLFIMIAAYFILIELYLVFINKMYIQDSASIFLILLILGLFFGKLSKFFAASIMHRFPTDTAGNTIPQEEEKVQRLASRLDMLWKIYDRSPAFVLFIFLASIQFNIFSLKLEKFHFWYLGIILFVLLGALFAKHYIEESMHYQRIRELVYVLETAFIAKVLNNDNLPNPLKIEKFDYEISLNLDRKLKILEAKKE
jgi:hypothetical protein